MKATTDEESATGRGSDLEDRLARQARAFYLSIPFYLALLPAFWLAYRWLGVELDWRLAGAGALGWWIALLLRAPVALAARRLPEERGKLLVVGSSGPLEEGIRLAALLLLSPSLHGALSLGLGWAAIEIVFALVNGGAIVHLLRREDEKALQARELLEAQGMLTASGPWYGIAERVFASVLHIGFTVFLLASPVLVLVAAPIHSAVNLVALRLTPRFGLVIALLAAVGTTMLLAGLALLGVLG